MTAGSIPVATSAAPLSPRRVLVSFSGLLLALLLGALDGTIVATALPTIVTELGGLERLSWVVTAYLLAQTIVTPLYGKLGDLYGRKRVLQSAVLIFLAGSVLCGLARSMTQLIVFRLIQGLGGGGLMVTTMAAVGDIIPPRERGRYQGIFGAVFGVSSIAGPLLGGYFTTHLSWRWIFYINLPLGALALAAIAATLPSPPERTRHRIDYEGAALLALALGAIVLLTDLGGAVYPWRSAPIAALAAGAIAALVAFVLVEQRAQEPVLPLRLFRNRAFSTTSAVGLIVGFAMFGSVTYLPLYLQTVQGATPTASGLQMLPMMGGMLVSSITTGQLISRTGRYRLFPIAGTAVMCVALFLLSRIDIGTSRNALLAMMLLLGLGMGLVMQVLVVAVQNAVPYRDLGVATSGNSLFRSIGGSVGTAALGAVFTAQLTRELAAGSTRAVAFTDAIATIFLCAFVVAIAGFLLTWLVPERPLRETVAATTETVGEEVGQAMAMPMAAEPQEELARGLAAVVDRDLRRRHFERIVVAARTPISAPAAWLLLRWSEHPDASWSELTHAAPFPAEESERGRRELLASPLVSADASSGAMTIGDAGRDVVAALTEARRAHLAKVFAEWSEPEQRELAALLRRLERELLPEQR